MLQHTVDPEIDRLASLRDTRSRENVQGVRGSWRGWLTVPRKSPLTWRSYNVRRWKVSRVADEPRRRGASLSSMKFSPRGHDRIPSAGGIDEHFTGGEAGGEGKKGERRFLDGSRKDGLSRTLARFRRLRI